MSTEIRLDVDSKHKWKKERIVNILDIMKLTVTDLSIHETHKGLHFRITVNGKIPPIALVTVQACMGSDHIRETFNLLRVLGGYVNGAGIQQDWNLLFTDKWEMDKATGNLKSISQEERRPDLEKKLWEAIKHETIVHFGPRTARRNPEPFKQRDFEEFMGEFK